MSATIKGKYIDRSNSSRLSSQGRSSLLPSIPSRRLDNFSFSIRRHGSSIHDQLNPEQTVLPNHYHDQKQLSQPTSPRQSIHRYRSVREKQEREDWEYQLSKMQEIPTSQIYQERIGENLKKYGAGMLRRSHRNSLGVGKSQQHLLELHYRLKKERQAAIILREERAGAALFRSLLGRYESI